MRRAALLLLVAALAWPVSYAGAQRPLTREQAREAIKKPEDIDARRLGAAWLGETGQMEDTPLLVEALRDRDEAVRSLAEHALWQVWSRSGDLALDRLFRLGVEQMAEQEHQAAIRTFSRIIQQKPEFAEGWNKRATVYYLVGEYQKSLADCEEVIRRNPIHFGALSGFGLIYLQLKRPDKALEYFERALRINPNLEQIRAAVTELKQLLKQRKRDSI
jgi:tetratricopeptide (TPR) repeat protein